MSDPTFPIAFYAEPVGNNRRELPSPNFDGTYVVNEWLKLNFGSIKHWTLRKHYLSLYSEVGRQREKLNIIRFPYELSLVD